MGKEYRATADYLADSLSKKTGTHFEVLRGRVRLDPRKPETVMRYGLRATRGEWSHTFQAWWIWGLFRSRHRSDWMPGHGSNVGFCRQKTGSYH